MKKIILPILKESLENAPIVDRGEYHYFIHPLTDGIPELSPSLLDEVADYMINIFDDGINIVDKIVTIESMGIPIATAVSLKTHIPLVIIRKRQYDLPGEIIVDQKTGYSNGELYINGINKGDRVVIVDDVISTGGTLEAVVGALDNAGVEICDIIVAVERDNGVKYLREKGYNVKTLVKIDVTADGVIINEG